MQLPAAGFVDVHVHIQPWEQLKPDVRAKMTQGRPDLEQISTFQGDPHAFAAYLDEMGVARCGLVNYPSPRIMGFDQSTNDFVAAYRDQRPDKFLAWGGMDPEWVDDPRGEMERLLDELRLDGIKVHPPHQGFRANAYLHELPELRVLYETCEARGVPVMVHTGTSVFPGARSNLGNPMDCDDVAVDFPDLKLVMAHCGRPLWYEEAFFVCRRHPNVMMDLSGIPPQQLTSVLPRLEMLGDKILWGTDWPSPGVKNLRTNAEAFAALDGLSDAFKMNVLVENPNRVWSVTAS
jgi:predicted TIM-barrel fold metal-dependent hydrolase